MKKNLITISISLVFLFLGVSFIKAETPSSVKVSERTAAVLLISKKVSELKEKCQSTNVHCESQLVDLVRANDSYMEICAPYYTHCNYGFLEYMLLQAAARYESCLALFGHAKNIDRNINREKRIKIQGKPDAVPIV